MATITRQAPVLPAPSGRAGFGGTLRSEFTKIGSVRSTYWTLLMLLAVSVGIGAVISAVVAGGWSQPPPPLPPGAPPPPPDIYEATQVSLAGLLVLGQLVIVVLGALVLSAEYSTGMIRTSLIAMPRRIVLYVAKAVAVAAVALVVSLATAFTAFFLGQALLASSHHSATLAGPGVLRAVIGSALYITLCGLFAFAAAAIIRNTAATITAMIGLLFVLPVLVNVLPTAGAPTWCGGCRARRPGSCRPRWGGRTRTCSPRGASSPCSPSAPRSCWSWAASCSASGTPDRPRESVPDHGRRKRHATPVSDNRDDHDE